MSLLLCEFKLLPNHSESKVRFLGLICKSIEVYSSFITYNISPLTTDENFPTPKARLGVSDFSVCLIVSSNV